NGILPRRDQIRTEEFVNFPAPDLAAPTDDTFAVYGELAPSPFGGREDRWLLRVGVRAKDVAREERPPLALTFVVDTSGSMRTDNRLELVKHSLRLLVNQLDARDTLAIVGFSNEAREILPPTPASASDTIETALFGLQPDGGTNAEAGLKLGYALSLDGPAPPNAQKRVVFLSDGVANMGQTDQDRLASEISAFAEQGVFLNTIGVGMSNHNDVFLEQLANKGQGVCDYVADAADARRAIVDRFVSGFVTVAKDLKIQVEFDGAAVLRWRQLGYENRAVADNDFRNDKVDAGEVGAGHQVTCYYEIELASGASDAAAALAKVRLRWKPVDPMVLGARTTETRETESTFRYEQIVAPSFRAASPGYRLGALSAQLAECLRQSFHARGDSMDYLAKEFANLLTDAPSKDVAAMAEAVKLGRDLGLQAPPGPQPTDEDAAQQEAYYRFLIESLGGADAPEGPAATPLGAPKSEAYELRIRELLNRDQGEDPH
ncbi:MAG: Ca-activated chloride channel family protein, partial [Planctomycetota bacterium]